MRVSSLFLCLSLLVACGGESGSSQSSSPLPGKTTSTSTASASGGAGGAGGVGGSGGAATTSHGGAGGAATTTTTTSTTSTTSTASGGAGGATGQGGAGGAAGGAPLAGYGAISGACGEIDLDDIVSPSPELLEAVVDFTGLPKFDPSLLTPEGKAMWDKGNLGGSSEASEVMAFEMLHRCDGAKLLKTETEIVYDTNSKKTDFLVEIDGDKVGVSVVRAMSYPEGSPYPLQTAIDHLKGKLSDILLSSASVSAQDAWKKQILAVLAQSPDHASAIQQAWDGLDAATKADTIVSITVTDGTDQFLYYNGP
jgi:hypothetical protein